MLCTNGHNNVDSASFCVNCGVNTFQNPSISSIDSSTMNGFAIAAMVLGIVWIYWIGSILALVFGYVARRQIKQRGQKGDGMAIAGIVLGWVGVASLIIVVIIAIAASSNSGS